jgi:hypothetical protein
MTLSSILNNLILSKQQSKREEFIKELKNQKEVDVDMNKSSSLINMGSKLFPLISTVMYNYLTDRENMVFNYAFYKCSHSDFVCKNCIHQVPGCCFSLLIKLDDRLRLLDMYREDFPVSLTQIGVYVNPDLGSLKVHYWLNRVHIMTEEDSRHSKLLLKPISDLVYLQCQDCFKHFDFEADPNLLNIRNCPECKRFGVQLLRGKLMTRVGVSSRTFADLDKMLNRNGNQISCPIDDPTMIEPKQSCKFNILNFECSKYLKQEFINRGGDESKSTKDDYIYNFEFDVEYKDIGAPWRNAIPEIVSYKMGPFSFREVNNFRHDFVANQLRSSTDKSLKELGINMNLTPDFQDQKTRTILELATNGSGQPKSMESSYIGKRIAYEDIAKLHKLTYLIVIVSPYNILTNMPIEFKEAEELTLRCRIAINVETMLEEKLDISLNSSDEDVKGMTQLISDLEDFNNTIELPENKHMDHELFDLLDNERPEEKDHVEDLLRKTLIKSLTGKSHKPNIEAMEEYVRSFNDENSRKKEKLVTIFPMIIAKQQYQGSRSSFLPLGVNKNCKKSLIRIFQNIFFMDDLTKEELLVSSWRMRSRMMSDSVEDKFKKYKYNFGTSATHGIHELRKSYSVTPLFDSEESHEMAMQGVQAKLNCDDPEILAKEADSKKSFHPDTDTSDIERFWSREDNIIENEEWLQAIDRDPVSSFIIKEKLSNPLNLKPTPDSVDLFSYLQSFKMVQLGELITDICIEMSTEYKVPTRPGEWLIKPLRRHKVLLAICCTGTHNFFSVAYEKSSSTIIDTGKIGPNIYETENYYISDITSITETYLEHFLKSGSYLTMIAAHLVHSFKIPILTGDWLFPVEYFQTYNYLALTFLNNKVDHEEMLTNLRFLYMKLFQEVGSNVFDYVDRLPSVLRSRLSAFSLKRIMNVMTYYRHNRMLRKKTKTMAGLEWEYKNIRSIYHNGFVTMEQLIDSFYYSYVISKNKSSMGDHTFQIFSKVSKENRDGQENIIEKGKKVWGLLEEPEKHRWDFALERHCLRVCLHSLQERHGPEVLRSIRKSVFIALQRIRFSDIATLKASSKDYEEGQKLPDWTDGMTREEFLSAFKKLNPKLNGKRPRVITTLSNLIQAYIEETKDQFPTPMKLILWSMKKLMKRGFTLSDLFLKDQHNGVREIHVIEIMARLCQYATEQMAKRICQYFENDSVCSPNSKKRFYQDHERMAQASIGKHITLGKSADASKWCQRNHVSEFFFEMSFFTPKVLHPFLYCMFFLWTTKRIAVSPQLLDNLRRNRDTFSTNPEYIKMREAFYNGTSPFMEKMGTFMEIAFGMFQGIFHDASCLKHDIVQTHWKVMVSEFLSQNMGLEAIITHIQGSDDSGALISIPSKNPGLLLLVIGLLWWKEDLSKYSSIWTSVPKSSIGTVNLIEYNSEWYYNGRNIKPTFRWNSACLETSLVERLPARMEMFYNSISSSLETGSSTLLCSVIQLCQANLHYKLMGLGSHLLTQECFDHLHRTKQVSLGYFPLELDHICGITGFDFQLYLLARQGVTVNNWELESHSDTAMIEYDSKIDKSIRESLRSFCIRFSNIKHYESVVSATGLPKLQDLLKKLEDNPELLFVSLNTWEQEEIKMVLSLENPSVKASLSAYQPTARMMASSVYLINTPCVTGVSDDGSRVKRSLLSWLKKSSTPLLLTESTDRTVKDDQWFCNQEQYKEFENYLSKLRSTIAYQSVSMKRSSKVDVLVWGQNSDVMIPLMDMVRRKWFNVRTIHCSNTVFELMWKSLCVRFPFLEETYKETKVKLGLEDISLFRFLQSISEKTRVVHLQDSTGRFNGLWNVATRVFWPNVKVRSSYDASEVSIRTLKNSIHCLMSYFFKKQYSLSKVKELILSSKELSKDSHDVPNYMLRLKVMRDVLDNKPKMEIIDMIERSKLGVIGYFRKAQSKTEKGYVGTGDWVGQIGGIDTVIHMVDTEVVYVKLQRLSDIVAQGRSLHMLIRDFKLSFGADPLMSHSKLYLNSKGSIERSVEKPENSCPLIVDKTLNLSIREKIVSQDWYIDSEGDTIKVCFSEHGRGKQGIQFTILSETFGAHCWDPLLPCPLDDDSNFYNWCKSMPSKPLTMLSQIMFPNVVHDVINLRRLIEEKKYTRPDSRYDLPKFLNSLKQFTDRKLLGRTFTELKFDYMSQNVPTTGTIAQKLLTKERIEMVKNNYKNLLNKYNVDGEITNAIMKSWEEEDEGDMDAVAGMFDETDDEDDDTSKGSSMYGESSWDITDKAMDEIRDMFEYEDTDLEVLQSNISSTYKGNVRQVEVFMSSFLDIFSDITDSQRLFEKLKINEMDEEDVLTGPGGSLLFVLYKKGRLENINLKPEHSALDENSVSEYVTASIARGELARDPMKLQEEIDQITLLLPALTNPLLSHMRKRLGRLESELEWINSSSALMESSEHLHIYDKMSFLKELYSQAASNGIYHLPVEHPSENTTIEMLLSYALDKVISSQELSILSASEVEEMRVAIWSPVLHPSCLKALCYLFESNISVSIDGKEVYDYHRSLFYQDFDANIKL